MDNEPKNKTSFISVSVSERTSFKNSSRSECAISINRTGGFGGDNRVASFDLVRRSLYLGKPQVVGFAYETITKIGSQ